MRVLSCLCGREYSGSTCYKGETVQGQAAMRTKFVQVPCTVCRQSEWRRKLGGQGILQLRWKLSEHYVMRLQWGLTSAMLPRHLGCTRFCAWDWSSSGLCKTRTTLNK
jgi:hypothetical protein